MKLFARQRSERERQIIEDWSETCEKQWMRDFIHFMSGDYENELSLERSCLTTSREIQLDNAEEVARQLAVLKLIYTHTGRPDEAACIEEKFKSIRDQIGDVPISRTMIEAFYHLAVAHKAKDDLRNDQHAFLSAFAALALSVLIYGRDVPSEIMERLFEFFQDLGFPRNQCGWLTRRADFFHTDVIGLVGDLIDEDLFPSPTTELLDTSESDPTDSKLITDYEISWMLEQSWMSFGFSEEFAISVAEGELSMRVERLIEEGGRCLRDVGGLSDLVLLFSSHLAGTHITILERDISSEEKRSLCDRIFCGILAEHGADSVMRITVRGTTLSISDSSLIPFLDIDADEEICVEARDSKSYISGVQRVRRTSRGYEFGEPVLSDAEDGSFSKFTFPFKPIIKKASTDAER